MMDKMMTQTIPTIGIQIHMSLKSETGTDKGYCGTLISPFAMNIVLKEKAKSWATPLSHGERDAIKKLQNEIDMILRKDAKKAALIIDHKSYQETPERYMLNRLLSIPFFCEYYGVWPLIGYPYKRHVSDRHAEYRTSIIKLMSWSINSDIYINRDRKIIYTLHEGLDERRMDLDLKMCSEFSSEFLREDSYQWGIRHKTDSMPG